MATQPTRTVGKPTKLKKLKLADQELVKVNQYFAGLRRQLKSGDWRRLLPVSLIECHFVRSIPIKVLSVGLFVIFPCILLTAHSSFSDSP